MEALREAYAKYEYTEHYTAMIDSQEVVVTPSAYLANEFKCIIGGMVH